MSFPSYAVRALRPTIGSIAFPAGTEIENRFVIDELIAEGRTARIYRARDADGELVALKVLRTEVSRPREAVERFAAEARACVELSAPNLPRLIRNGRLADGTPYLALTYFDGPTLDEVLDSGRLAVASVLQLGAELARALDDVHAHGLVHCHVNPSNIILCRRTGPQGMLATGALVDFGLSRRLQRAPRLATVVPFYAAPDPAAYHSPEQLHGGLVGARSDIFALGAVLYHALTGAPPFAGSTVSELREPIAPVASLRPDCPQELDRVLLRTLHRDPDFRWASARRLADELSWMQAHCGFGLMRRWKDELRTGKYVIAQPRR